MAADKPVIPTFLDKGDIPPQFKGKLGVDFSGKRLAEAYTTIYAVTKKQLGGGEGGFKKETRRSQ